MNLHHIFIALLNITLGFQLHGQTNSGAPPMAQPTAVIDVWPEGKMPGQATSDQETNKMPDKTDATRMTNVSHPTLLLYPTAAASETTVKPVPAMIVCPGGGYSYVVVDKEGSQIATWLNSNGISALVLKYRTPNNRVGAFMDAQRALSLVRARAAEWNIDTNRLGIIGFSAGGNLAAKSSSLFGARSYAAIDEIDQVSCRPDFAVLVYPAYLDDRNGHISPDLDLKANIPPTLIVHNDDDKTFVPGSKLYNAALNEAKVPHEFLDYLTGGHGYGLQCTKDAKAWPGDALVWFRKTGVLTTDGH